MLAHLVAFQAMLFPALAVLSAALEDCENVRGLSVERAMVEIIDPPGQEPDQAMPTDGYSICDAGCGPPPCNRHWPDPTPEMLSDLKFEAIWPCIKTWDINVPHAYDGYCGATGNHVRAILDALQRS